MWQERLAQLVTTCHWIGAKGWAPATGGNMSVFSRLNGYLSDTNTANRRGQYFRKHTQDKWLYHKSILNNLYSQ